MKKLENYGVLELNTEEVKNIEGGFLITLPLVGFVWGYLYEKYVS